LFYVCVKKNCYYIYLCVFMIYIIITFYFFIAFYYKIILLHKKTVFTKISNTNLKIIWLDHQNNYVDSNWLLFFYSIIHHSRLRFLYNYFVGLTKFNLYLNFEILQQNRSIHVVKTDSNIMWQWSLRFPFKK